MSVIASYILPGLPQPLLTPEANPGYGRLRDAFEKVRAEIEQSDADVLILYSTMWPSVIGHQILSRPNPVSAEPSSSMPSHRPLDVSEQNSFLCLAM